MKSILLYGSNFGRTRKVVAAALQHLVLKPDVFDVKDFPAIEMIIDSDLLFFFSPTYGDGELQPHMEGFIRQFSVDLTEKYFVICELGNTHGYDDFGFGAMAILRRRLLKLGGKELCSHLSLDTMPRVNWGHLNRWVDHVNHSIARHERY